ncbi:MAG TPA: GGDEF domain-containing protein, partial [Anaerolineales bacterium]|nr:GGDEF domain-containing protein [Anaerolineales bacterium]
QGEIVQYKSIRYRRDGSPVDVEIFGVPVVVCDQQLGVLVLYSDITEQKRAEGFLQHIASHDSLTGLPNRMLFSDRLKHAIQKTSRSGGKLAVAFLDLDNFKKVNDTYGHGKGDLILKEVAERLKCGVRASDTIARLGGDEFTFIFEAIGDARDVLSISQKIVDTLVDPFELDGNHVLITASVGVSLFPDDGDNSVILIRKADEAMYASKLLGQNRCQLYSRESVDQPEIFKKQPTLSKK